MGMLLFGRMFIGFGCGAMFSTVYAIISAIMKTSFALCWRRSPLRGSSHR